MLLLYGRRRSEEERGGEWGKHAIWVLLEALLMLLLSDGRRVSVDEHMAGHIGW